MVHRRRAEPDEAIRFHERARRLADQVREPGLRTQLYLERAAIFFAASRSDEAEEAYFAALDLAGETDDRGRQAHANHGVAQVRHHVGEHHQAASHWRAALDGLEALRWAEAEEVRQELAGLTCSCVTGQGA